MTELNNHERPSIAKMPAQGNSLHGVEAVNTSSASHEVHDNIDGVLEGIGNHSEVIGENASENMGGGHAKDGGASSAGQTANAAQFKGKIAKIPSERVMRAQVASSIEKEIRVLERKVSRMNFFGRFDPNRFNSLVDKIRELYAVLASLAYSTVEQVKGLWLKHVKGQA